MLDPRIAIVQTEKNKFKKKLVDLNNKYGGYGIDELIDTRHFFVFQYNHV